MKVALSTSTTGGGSFVYGDEGEPEAGRALF